MPSRPGCSSGSCGCSGSSTSGGDVQFIIATRSPLLPAFPDAEIFSFDGSPIRKPAYEDTDRYRIYRGFLDDREKYLDAISRAE